MYFEQITTPGLGCFSFAIGCPAAGVMAVIDPRRDIDVYLRVAGENSMRVTHIFDTHVHADHVSGAQDLREAAGADIYVHESVPAVYEAKKLKNGDEFTFGNAALRVLHTPGHTPNSVSFLVTDLGRSVEPQMILTGDLLFVGDVGRPDLPGEEILSEQVESLYTSLYKTLAPLPDYLEVYPSHGQGSLCGKGMSAKPFSTLGYERRANPMLQYPDFDSFKQAILSNTPMRPQSFSAIINTNINTITPIPKRGSGEYALCADKTDAMRASGALLLDLRDAFSFAAAHISGSINVDFSDGPKLNWVGVALPPNVPLVLVLSHDDCFEDTYLELRRIGCDQVKGWLKGGIHAWIESGRETESLECLSVSTLQARLTGSNPPVIIDVRSPDEFKNVKIENAVNLTFDRLVKQKSCPVDSARAIVVVCQGGFRAGIAASMLKAQGCANVGVLTGGMNAWTHAR